MVGKIYKAKKNSQRPSYVRVTAMIVVSFLIIGVITFRLFVLQVNEHGYYAALAQDQHTLYQELVPERGQIYIKDTAGNLFPLAANRELYLVYAVPNIITDAEAATKKVAEILGIQTPEQRAAAEASVATTKKPEKPLTAKEKAEAQRKEQDAQGVILYSGTDEAPIPLTYERLQQKLSNKTDKYEALANRITKEKADALVAAKIAGIRVTGQDWRYYPENSFAAQVIGYVGYKGDKLKGQYGIEGFFDDLLTGKKGFLEGERDNDGNWISIGNKTITPAEDGSSLVLTLDRSIQYAAEKYAKMATQEDLAQESSIIVLEPKTGKILGMANYPTYNLNDFSGVQDPSVFNNSVVFDLFEPGSIFKPIVMASALDAGVVTPSTTFDNTGSVKVGKYTISNVVKRSQRITTMTEVLDWSLNTGMVYVAQHMGRDKLYEYLKRFGFDELTGVSLNSESASQLGDPKSWSDAQLATMSFGQGVSTTELHMAMAEAALANGGKLMQPQIVSEIRHPDGRVEPVEPKVVGQPISPQTSQTITAMLIDGVKNGLSKKAAVPGYLIAGKTGTAQVAQNGKYDPSQRITTFMGYAPATDPKFLIIVKVVNPKRGEYAETTAIPYFQKLATEVINYLKIPPQPNAQ